MAVVLPFRALRYDPAQTGGLECVMTQPYDKISPEMQREYLRRSPFNLVHLIRGLTEAQDSATENVYTRAAGTLRAWRAQGILKQDTAPAFYVYFQQFRSPLRPDSAPLTRKGFIGLGRLEPYYSGVVFRHEQTLSAPKADRLELLRATRAHLESIMMLYSDPRREIEQLLEQQAQRPPAAQLQDEYGVLHTLWIVEDTAKLGALQQALSDKKLIIADGHHRYETALNFERECRAQHAPSGTAPSLDFPTVSQPDCAFALMTFFNTDGEGIVILPTHRVLAGLPGWNRDEFLARAAPYFHLEIFPFAGAGGRTQALAALQRQMAEPAQQSLTATQAAGLPVLGALFEGQAAFYSLRARSDVAWDRLLADLSPAQRALDVNILHRVALGLCLGVDEESVRQEQYLQYVRQFDEAIEPVLQGAAQACFFLRPAGIGEIREIAFSGELLPQKSTDFYPKLLSGLAMYPLNH